MYGHANMALMNGGRKKWELEGRPLTTEAPAVSPTTYRSRGLDLPYRAYLQDVLGYVDQSDGRGLVDVRSPAEFNGEIIAPPGLPETAQRRGHVPGASNIPWVQAANEDGTFKSADELRALYGGKGSVRTRRSSRTVGSASVRATPGSCCLSPSQGRSWGGVPRS
jgi:thiosulfate/3-mercaptopyruvate sulfurtransferase